MINLFLWLLFAHFVGDFVLQSHRMSTLKSKDWGVLFEHVAIYTGTIFTALFFVTINAIDPVAVVAYCVTNGALHFCTDAITSRMTAALWKAERVHDFFVVVGADQFVHALCLGLTLQLIV